MLRNRVFMVVMVVLVCVLASGTGLATKITVLARNAFDENFDQAVKLFVTKTGIEVEVVRFTNWVNLKEKLPTMVAGGVAPDVVYHDNGSQAQFIVQGIMAPLDDLAAKFKFNTTIWPKPVMDAMSLDGKLFGLPTGVSPFAVYYNSDRFSEAGVAEPPTKWGASNWTLSNFRETGRKLTADKSGDGTPDLYGADGFLANGISALPLWNLQWMSSDLTEFLGDRADYVSVVSELAEMFLEDGFLGGSFTRNNAAMSTSQINYVDTLERLSAQGGFFGWRIAPLPKVISANTNTGFHGFGITNDSKHKEEAFRFIEFITSDKDGALLFNKAEKRLPVLASSLKTWELERKAAVPGTRPEVYVNSLDFVWRSNTSIGLPSAVYATILEALTQAVNGDKPAQAAMLEVKPKVDSLLAEAAEARSAVTKK